jgi:hypothetical protein
MADIDATQTPTVEGVDPSIDDGDEFESKVRFLQLHTSPFFILHTGNSTHEATGGGNGT